MPIGKTQVEDQGDVPTVKFGMGDVVIGCGCVTEDGRDSNGKANAIVMSEDANAHAVGDTVRSADLKEKARVVLTFTKIESIDLLIEQLALLRLTMRTPELKMVGVVHKKNITPESLS